jgi:hypothetical protein
MKTLHKRCAGLDVHKMEVVACQRIVSSRKAGREVRRFPTTTHGLLELKEWLERGGCTHVAMEATGVYWKPVWQILEGHSTGVQSTPSVRSIYFRLIAATRNLPAHLPLFRGLPAFKIRNAPPRSLFGSSAVLFTQRCCLSGRASGEFCWLHCATPG